MAQKRRENNEEEQKDTNLSDNLAYDTEKESYEYDVEDRNPDYDHPADYPTLSEGAEDDDSTYDEANPFVGDEYEDREELKEDNREEANMHIIEEEDLKVSDFDKRLAEDMEDYRDDLDEEGYPKKNK